MRVEAKVRIQSYAFVPACLHPPADHDAKSQLIKQYLQSTDVFVKIIPIETRIVLWILGHWAVSRSLDKEKVRVRSLDFSASDTVAGVPIVANLPLAFCSAYPKIMMHHPTLIKRWNKID